MRRPPPFLATGCAFACVLAWAAPCAAQVADIPITLNLDAALLADNTEFFNPFRSGETILGSNQRLFLNLELSSRANLRLGVFAIERAGSTSAIDRGLPIVSIALGAKQNHFVIGTLETTDRAGVGADRTTPHGLLPALATETQWFTRAYEAGIQWRTDLPRFTQDLWFDYQRMNTPAYREKFDAGVVNRVRVTGPLSIASQFHVVHHGGQQYSTGPVSDSVAFGSGVLVEGRVGRLPAASAEAYVLGSYDRPDRGAPELTTQGAALFLRATAEARGWRGHAIVWRGKDFNHEDGDPNYLSRLATGAAYRGTRDYAEMGLAKVFKAAPSVDFEASGRVHRIESAYDYSYRMLAIIHLQLLHN